MIKSVMQRINYQNLTLQKLIFGNLLLQKRTGVYWMFLRAAVSTILPVKDAIVLLEFRYQYFKENLVAGRTERFFKP